ncbi:MAG TPA: LuxR C-terminal-related transcriptional regulator [Streptosporangiaceae bacterium]|nr:LuxR C-terminal-related transcriptional regulator [Streptosporangiaceae bacterium]
MLSKYLSVTDVQRELGLSAAQVQYLIDSRRLPAFRVFGKWRIERELLEQMVDNLYEADLHEEESRADIGGGEQAGQQPMAESATDPPRLTAGMLETAARIAVLPRRQLDGALGLTGQQQKVLELVGQGLSNAEIAANLTVEISTVKSHVSRILQRCGLRDREQLIVLAWQSGLMSDSSPGAAAT